MALPRPCKDCGTIARAARCDECDRKYKRIKEATRPSRAQRGYDYQWRKISKALRQEQPWCSACGKTTDLTVDHIQPLADGGLTVRSNLQVLCRGCNSSKADR
jgi:5-methylcytosine-specific restriction endonuclease McrA